jgi:ABC-type multidrug transport system fused ATPase/permease subunit
MWTALAAGTGLSYFFMAFVAMSLTMVSYSILHSLICLHIFQIVIAHYSLQYFNCLLFQKTSFFDDENNSVGTLTSRLSGDVKQLEELLGMNLAMVLQS